MITRKILLASMIINFGVVPFAHAESSDIARSGPSKANWLLALKRGISMRS
jgi:hypothetical protein